MSFAFISTLVIMKRTALEHSANDPISAQGEKGFVCLSYSVLLYLALMPIKLSKPAYLLVRRIEIEEE